MPRNPLMIDPEAVRVPDPADPSDGGVVGNSIPVAEFYDPNHADAVQFQRSTPPDPTRGLKAKDMDAERTKAKMPGAITGVSITTATDVTDASSCKIFKGSGHALP